MSKIDRIKLHFGPYKTPRFRYGSTVFDESWGEVRIVGISDARIPWPIGQRGTHRSLVLYMGLARAVRKESRPAIMHWWGVKVRPVLRWRKSLDVPRINPGTSRLYKANGQGPWMERARRNSRAGASDPVRRAKIAASKVGKPRPAHVLRELLKARRGKPLSAEHRRKISQSLKGTATRYRREKPWAAWEDALLALPMREIMSLTGRSMVTIRKRRREVYSARQRV